MRIIYLLIYDLIFETILSKITSMEQAETAVKILNVVSVTLRLSVCAAVLAVFGKLIGTRLTGRIRRREFLWLIFTPLIGSFFVNIVYRMLGVMKDGIYFELYEFYPSFKFLVPVSELLLFAGIAASICICGSMRKLEEERRAGFVREQQIKELERRIEQENRADEAARRLRHDMRSHLMNLQGMIDAGRCDDAMEYIRTAGKNFDGQPAGGGEINTGNPVTDIIINDAYCRAKNSKISFDSDFRYERGAGKGIELFDLGIAVSNLLTNALEACESCKIAEKFIVIRSETHGNFYLIEVKNSFLGEIKWDAKGEFPLSSKQSGEEHGIGLGNVARVAQKYNGSLEFNAGGGCFTAAVMLQSPGGQEIPGRQESSGGQESPARNQSSI